MEADQEPKNDCIVCCKLVTANLKCNDFKTVFKKFVPVNFSKLSNADFKLNVQNVWSYRPYRMSYNNTKMDLILR